MRKYKLFSVIKSVSDIQNVKVKKIFFLLILSFGILSGKAGDIPKTIPAVQHWKSYKGQLELVSPRIIINENYSEELLPIANILSSEWQLITGRKITIEKGNRKLVKGNIYLTTGDASLSAEGYTLNVKDGIEIEAAGVTGVFYGTRTLLQLVVQHQTAIPKGMIKDYPKYPVRSILLDVARKFIPFTELKDWITALSYFKINEIHLHLNDNCHPFYGAFRVEMKTIKGLTSTDGYYTQQEIRELQDYAKARGISIVPEIDSPGHSRSFTTVRPDLAHPQLGGNYLDITKEDSYRFVEKVFDEIVPLFDAEDFHIGTDEYRLNLIKDEQEKAILGEKFRQYINHFNQYIRAKGKTVRIWSGYENMPGTTEPDKSIVIDMWETSDALNKSKAGYQFINSTHLWTYIVPGAPYYGVNNKFLYEEWTPLRFSKKPEGTLSPKDKGLLGGKFHVWNDKGPTGYTTNEIARLTMPTVLVMAEKLWGTKGSSDYEKFTQRAKRVLPGADAFEMLLVSHDSHSAENVLCGQVPGTHFLKRQAATLKPNVWQYNEPSHFIANTFYPLHLGAENLEYPWTATFTVTRFTDVNERWEKRPSGHEALLSSKLGTLFLDYTWDVRDEKTKLTIDRKKGVAIVRANSGQAPTPESHVLANIEVFNYQVPLNQKVKLTFVGYQNKTELYVDGKLVDSIKKQMVCPLTNLGGDEYTPSFHGILHEAAIYDYAAPVK
ncbi:family 20 glycosylhydrolase [Sunxiuqinia sp. sy24]|uniref:family 20 glycosylhydrolase n=1 Tax=Sunxiuqinia sp. sy24 TaxID=3461495 RepID=UPI0040465ACD